MVEVPRTRAPEEFSPWRIAVEFAFLGLLFVGALIAPIGVYLTIGPVAGIVTGVVVPATWISLLPNSCMNGGLLFAKLALVQFYAGCAWIFAALVLLILSLV